MRKSTYRQEDRKDICSPCFFMLSSVCYIYHPLQQMFMHHIYIYTHRCVCIVDHVEHILSLYGSQSFQNMFKTFLFTPELIHVIRLLAW